jgi:hypothetical protein
LFYSFEKSVLKAFSCEKIAEGEDEQAQASEEAEAQPSQELSVEVPVAYCVTCSAHLT